MLTICFHMIKSPTTTQLKCTSHHHLSCTGLSANQIAEEAGVKTLDRDGEEGVRWRGDVMFFLERVMYSRATRVNQSASNSKLKTTYFRVKNRSKK